MSPLPVSWVSFLVGLLQEEEREQRTQKRQQIALTRTDLWLASLLVYGNSLLDLRLQPALESFLVSITIPVSLTEQIPRIQSMELTRGKTVSWAVSMFEIPRCPLLLRPLLSTCPSMEIVHRLLCSPSVKLVNRRGNVSEYLAFPASRRGGGGRAWRLS